MHRDWNSNERTSRRILEPFLAPLLSKSYLKIQNSCSTLFEAEGPHLVQARPYSVPTCTMVQRQKAVKTLVLKKCIQISADITKKTRNQLSRQIKKWKDFDQQHIIFTLLPFSYVWANHFFPNHLIQTLIELAGQNCNYTDIIETIRTESKLSRQHWNYMDISKTSRE